MRVAPKCEISTEPSPVSAHMRNDGISEHDGGTLF